MTIKYIENFDLLHIKLASGQVSTSQPSENEDIILEWDADGKLVGLEVLNASESFANLEEFLSKAEHIREAQSPSDASVECTDE